MNKKEAYSNIIQYKNNKRVEEESNELEHGLLSKFKAKYLEKIPLGNGKFRYIYEEAKDKVKSASQKVTSAIKTSSAKVQEIGNKISSSVKQETKEKPKEKTEVKKQGSVLGIIAVSAAAALAILPSVVRVGKFFKEYSAYSKEKKVPQESKDELKTYPPPPESVEDSYKKTNERYPAFGTTNNCVACSMTMELRQRGYDVHARMFADGVDGEKMLQECFKDPKIDHVSIKTPDGGPISEEQKPLYVESIKKAIGAGYEDGARGMAMIQWEGVPIGHAIYFTVENGKAVFYDGQDGARNSGDVEAMLRTCDLTNVRVARLDNLELNDKIGEAVISND